MSRLDTNLRSSTVKRRLSACLTMLPAVLGSPREFKQLAICSRVLWLVLLVPQWRDRAADLN